MSRAAVVAALGSLVALACGPSKPAAPPGPPPVPLHIDQACDLAPAAGLTWIADVRPREIAEIPDLIPALGLVIPEARFAAFAEAHGGVDLRRVQRLCIARYKDATLSIARTPLDAARVERAFAARVTVPGGRAVDVPNPPVIRLWGEVTGEPQSIVIFGRDAVVLEQGKGSLSRVSEAFALGKLRRAAPALRGAALSRADKLLGEAPVRVFVSGPFEGEAAQGLGGLLRASTALAASARFVGPPARIEVQLVLVGAWDKDAPAAAERLAAAVHVIAESPPGRLFGLAKPLEEPRVRAGADALVLTTTIDGLALARGLHDAVDAEVGEIMAR